MQHEDQETVILAAKSLSLLAGRSVQFNQLLRDLPLVTVFGKRRSRGRTQSGMCLMLALLKDVLDCRADAKNPSPLDFA